MRRRSIRVTLSALASLFLALSNLQPGQGLIQLTRAAQELHGYSDFSYFYNPNSNTQDLIQTPTGEKPQSKLWYNDDRWWADMIASDGKHYIYYLSGQTWVKTSAQLDDRTQTKSDCLWDGTHLYVVSGGGSASTGTDLDAELRRYSYSPNTQTYVADDLDPSSSKVWVTVRAGGAETIVIDKDTTGKLWITYTQGKKVWINRSAIDDAHWGTAFNPPSAPGETTSANVDSDDISSLVAYNDKIGVLWSKHDTSVQVDPNAAFYFAYRSDSSPDSIAAWQTTSIYHGPNYSDDHINIKSLQASGKEVYAVVKTSINGQQSNTPQILLLAGKPNANGDLAWSATMVSSGLDNQTRPILLIDRINRQLYVFESDESGGSVYYKQTSMDTIQFAAGKGTPFISSTSYTKINNATSTKQSVSPATGIVVLASNDNSGSGTAQSPAIDFYLHNELAIAKANQTIGFGTLPDHTNGDVPFAIGATASSGLPVSLSATGTCALSGTLLTLTGAGSCTVTASQPGDANYNPASNVQRSFTIAKAGQTITFRALPNHTYGDAPFEVSATASSGLAVSFGATGTCALSGTLLTLTGAGSCTVTASQPGDANYNPASNVQRSFTIAKAGQTITFGALPNHTYGDAPFEVSATASSGLPVSFSAVGPCTVAGSRVALAGIGSCTVTASQPGGADYTPALDVAHSFQIAFKIYLPMIWNAPNS